MKTKSPPKIDLLAQKIREAIKRLEASSPLNPELQERLKSGKSIHSISAVALEAGVSRTCIGHAGCAYPAERLLALAYVQGANNAKQLSVQLEQCKEERNELRVGIASRDAIIAAQMIRIRALESKEKSSGKPGDNIVPFVRTDSRRSSTNS